MFTCLLVFISLYLFNLKESKMLVIEVLVWMLVEVLAKKRNINKKIFTLESVSINVSMKVNRSRKGTSIKKNIKYKY